MFPTAAAAAAELAPCALLPTTLASLGPTTARPSRVSSTPYATPLRYLLRRSSQLLLSPPLSFFASRPAATTPPRAMAAGEGSSAEGQNGSSALPEITTEFMVEMKCEGCVKNVRRNVENIEGVSLVDISLESQVVRVKGTSPLQALEEGLKNTGLRSRLIGQGDPEKLDLTAAVAEFKGPEIHGVVRFIQVSMELARVEAQFDGLSPNARHGWSVNEFGDLTRGAASTGGHYNPDGHAHGAPDSEERHAGDLGNLETDSEGHASYVASNDKLKVWDLIGRAVVVYQGADDGGKEGSGNAGEGIAAAVIARSAGVGENYKSLCTCDGTIIWEATDSDYVTQRKEPASAL